MTNIRNDHFSASEDPHASRNGSCKMVHHLILPTQCNSTGSVALETGG